MTKMSLLKCENLSVGYEKKAVLENISFEVNEGDYLCIIGANGTGKTTLMKTLLGLLPPVGGSISKSDDLKRSLGYLPQQTETQKDFPASVWEVVLSGCQCRMGMRPFYSKEDKERADKNIERMGLTSLKKRCFRELSGGQQQRVLLARALCATDKLLLLDEPVSGLDPETTIQFYDLVKKLNDGGTAVIMITHDTDRALSFATHILDVGNKEITQVQRQQAEEGEQNG